MLSTKIVLNVLNNFCTPHVLPKFELGIFTYWTWNSMNNMLSYCGLVDAKIRAPDKDLPVLVVLLTGQLKPARTVLTYLHRTVPPSMGLSVWCGLVCTGLEWARSLAQTSARIGRRPASPPVAVFPCTGIQWVQCAECVLMAPQLTDGRVWWKKIINPITPSNSEIICVQNVGAKVEMVSYLKK